MNIIISTIIGLLFGIIATWLEPKVKKYKFWIIALAISLTLLLSLNFFTQDKVNDNKLESNKNDSANLIAKSLVSDSINSKSKIKIQNTFTFTYYDKNSYNIEKFCENYSAHIQRQFIFLKSLDKEFYRLSKNLFNVPQKSDIICKIGIKEDSYNTMIICSDGIRYFVTYLGEKKQYPTFLSWSDLRKTRISKSGEECITIAEENSYYTPYYCLSSSILTPIELTDFLEELKTKFS